MREKVRRWQDLDVLRAVTHAYPIGNWLGRQPGSCHYSFNIDNDAIATIRSISRMANMASFKNCVDLRVISTHYLIYFYSR